MPRELTRTPPDQLSAPKVQTLSVTLETVTPMFGGSATRSSVDPVYPVRAASVRGQLRFWWRATQPRHLSKETMFEREEALFGSDAVPGTVQVSVRLNDPGKTKSATSFFANRSSGPLETYFLFPFRQRNDEKDGLLDVQFEVTVTFRSDAPERAVPELTRALQAWIAFGGVGARTRRGCGALRAVGEQADQFNLDLEALKSWFPQPEQSKAEQEKSAPFTTLHGAQLFLTSAQNARDGSKLWQDLGRFWAQFHKGHYERSYNPMGGSHWNDHKTLLQGQFRDEIALVKPFLGLPLNYHSFNRETFGGRIDAATAQNGEARFASPVILKPVALKGGQLAGAVLILNGPAPAEVTIGTKRLRLKVDRADPVLRELDAETALDAVAQAARRSGYKTEVGL